MNVRKQVLTTLGAAALVLATSTSAFAMAVTNDDSENVVVEITPKIGGTVTVLVTETTAFPDQIYSLAEQTTSGVLTVQTSDDRGNAAGWNVTLKATDFVEADTADIAINNLVLLAQPVVKNSVGGTTPAAGSNQSPVTTTAQQLWDAAPATGDGIFSLPMNGTLTIPAGTLVGTYTSTVTAEVSFAP